MKDKTSPEKGGTLLVSAEILKSINISVEQLRNHLIELKLIFGTRFDLVIPKRINDISALQWVIGLSQRFQKLRQCDGFDRHIKTYTKKQLQSSYFVMVIASYLLDKVDNVVLEPHIIGRIKKSDILINFRGEQVYLECKHSDDSKFDYSGEHEHMFSILRDYITVPHQISIRYKKSFSDEALHKLGETLRERVNLVTGDGRIINTSDLEVQVITREAHEAHWDKKIHVIMSIIETDLFNNCSYPGHVYCREGITLSLSGPQVSYAKVLREKIRRSRSQSPQDQPYILMIDGNSILGDLTENIRALSTAFQPKTNTRFSAAALVTYHPRLDSPDLDLNFNLVSNPFAKFPVDKEFERLFRTS